MEAVKTIEEIEFNWVDSLSDFDICEVCNFPEYKRKYMITRTDKQDSRTTLWMQVLNEDGTTKNGTTRFINLGEYKTKEDAKLSAKEELAEVLNIVNCSKNWDFKCPDAHLGINNFDKNGIDFWIRQKNGSLNECWLPKEKIRELRQYLQRIEEYINFYE